LPERFAEITRRWAAAPLTDSSDFEIPLGELPADEYQKAHKDMFKDTKTVFNPETEQATIMSTVKSYASRAGKILTDLVNA